jgi:hypothetical protein
VICESLILLQINPQHSVPTLVDGDFTIWDSHAIVGYLVGQHGSDDLYPKETKPRASVDQFLHFDSGVLYPRVNTIIVSTASWTSSADLHSSANASRGRHCSQTGLNGASDANERTHAANFAPQKSQTPPSQRSRARCAKEEVGLFPRFGYTGCGSEITRGQRWSGGGS